MTNWENKTPEEKIKECDQILKEIAPKLASKLNDIFDAYDEIIVNLRKK